MPGALALRSDLPPPRLLYFLPAEDDEVPLESIIEATLQRHIVAPLHHHIYSYLLQHFGRGGDLRRLSENMKVLIKASPEEIGMDDKVRVGAL